jgi:hypothetical protein
VKGYTETVVFTKAQKDDLAFAVRLVEALPAKDKSNEWVRCHELVRVIAPLLSNRWHVIDGHVGSADHSWLVWAGKGHVVLDVYACGVLPQVQLVDCNPLWRRDGYRPGAARRDIRPAIIDWLGAELLRAEIVSLNVEAAP